MLIETKNLAPAVPLAEDATRSASKDVEQGHFAPFQLAPSACQHVRSGRLRCRRRSIGAALALLFVNTEAHAISTLPRQSRPTYRQRHPHSPAALSRDGTEPPSSRSGKTCAPTTCPAESSTLTATSSMRPAMHGTGSSQIQAPSHQSECERGVYRRCKGRWSDAIGGLNFSSLSGLLRRHEAVAPSRRSVVCWWPRSGQ